MSRSIKKRILKALGRIGWEEYLEEDDDLNNYFEIGHAMYVDSKFLSNFEINLN